MLLTEDITECDAPAVTDHLHSLNWIAKRVEITYIVKRLVLIYRTCLLHPFIKATFLCFLSHSDECIRTQFRVQYLAQGMQPRTEPPTFWLVTCSTSWVTEHCVNCLSVWISDATCCFQVNTELHETRSCGVNHVEGGWPKDIDSADKKQTSLFRNKVEKDESYSNSVLQLCRVRSKWIHSSPPSLTVMHAVWLEFWVDACWRDGCWLYGWLG